MVRRMAAGPVPPGRSTADPPVPWAAVAPMRHPGQVRALLASVLAVGVTACSAVGVGAGAATTEGELSEPPIRVAAGPDAETVLLAHTMARLLELSDLPAEVVPFAEARDARQALELGDVDVRPGYTGEAWLETLGRDDPPGDPAASFLAVRDHDLEHGIRWLRPRFVEGVDQPPANATFAFVVQGPPSVDADLRTMSQLASRLAERPDERVCVDREFGARPDGLRAVLEAYSMRSDRPFLAAGPEEAVLGVAAGDCLAGLTTATDGAAWRAGLRPLVDDLKVFPAFVPLPQIRTDALRERGAIQVALGPMAAQLTTARLGAWNARVVAGEPIEEVADDAARTLLELANRPAPDEG
jgi:glycine betaine/choline ABC-type transport system substrate-binding protein